MPNLIDFSNVEAASDFEALPVSTYHMSVEKAEFMQAKSDDKYPNIKVSFRVVEHDEEELVGRTVTKWFSLSPDAKPYTVRDLIQLGFSPDTFAGQVDIDEIISEMVSEQFEAWVRVGQRSEVDEITGLPKVFNEVKGIQAY